MKAEKLNRNPGGWAFISFLFPVISMIWISALKPLINWVDEN